MTLSRAETKTAYSLSKMREQCFTVKPISKGKGIGLASVKPVVKASSNDIRVKSERGKGKIFVVKIPVEKKGD
jgi:two-component system, NtrC family, sensor kinase